MLVYRCQYIRCTLETLWSDVEIRPLKEVFATRIVAYTAVISLVVFSGSHFSSLII